MRKISILIANYNYAKYLQEAVDSVLAQTYQNVEIVIVDDGSTDNSHEVITQLQQKSPDKIKAIFQSNQGQAAAFNRGFEATTGDIVAFLDADDFWKPDKLQLVVEAFNTSDVVGVLHHLDVTDADGNIFAVTGVGKSKSENVAQIVLDTGNTWCFPPTSGLTFLHSALEKVLPVDPAQWRLHIDGCLIYSTAFLGKIKTLEQILGSYRNHGENIHATHEVTQEVEAKWLEITETTNQYINTFLERINYPARVDLSRNLHYQRSKYYLRGKWDARNVLTISRLILQWRLYTKQQKLYYLMRFLLKNTKLIATSAFN